MYCYGIELGIFLFLALEPLGVEKLPRLILRDCSDRTIANHGILFLHMRQPMANSTNKQRISPVKQRAKSRHLANQFKSQS